MKSKNKAIDKDKTIENDNISNNNYIEESKLVEEILEDFKIRQMDRKYFDTKWQLNLNYFTGNQYCTVNGKGDIVDNYKQYFWEEREVYNHIAPLIELRLSKLSKVRPSLTVVPFSDDQKDKKSAKISKLLIKSTSYDINLSKILTTGTMWSEICGSVFYKVGWDNNAGKIIAKNELGSDIKEGEIKVMVVSPFEIYPDNQTYSDIQECKSIIFARAFHKDTVKNMWGVDVEGTDVNVFTMENVTNIGGLGYSAMGSTVAKKVKKNHVLVIEKYETPSVEFPNGRLIIIAGDKMVYMGELPYINLDNGKRGFPFIKQCAIPSPNCFWGTSIIERCIPIQKSFNAIKNRKHEFLNRLTMGILAVEDGSLDIENLEEEGLSPGKVLIYRQGSNSPKMITSGSVPLDFQYEESQLLSEFLNISGVSDLLNTKSISTNVSGVALQLLIEQDEVRLLTSAEEIRYAAKDIAKHILKLYKQFAVAPHSSRVIDNANNIEMFYWSGSDITSDDVVFETENEINETLAQKRSMIYELLKTGLLFDEEGKLNNSMRQKILEQLGFGIWDLGSEAKSLQVQSAEKENLSLILSGEIENPKEIDDHKIHINEHICFMLSNEFEKEKKYVPAIEEIMLSHIKEHKVFNSFTEIANAEKNK